MLVFALDCVARRWIQVAENYRFGLNCVACCCGFDQVPFQVVRVLVEPSFGEIALKFEFLL